MNTNEFDNLDEEEDLAKLAQKIAEKNYELINYNDKVENEQYKENDSVQYSKTSNNIPEESYSKEIENGFIKKGNRLFELPLISIFIMLIIFICFFMSPSENINKSNTQQEVENENIGNYNIENEAVDRYDGEEYVDENLINSPQEKFEDVISRVSLELRVQSLATQNKLTEIRLDRILEPARLSLDTTLEDSKQIIISARKIREEAIKTNNEILSKYRTEIESIEASQEEKLNYLKEYDDYAKQAQKILQRGYEYTQKYYNKLDEAINILRAEKNNWIATDTDIMFKTQTAKDKFEKCANEIIELNNQYSGGSND